MISHLTEDEKDAIRLFDERSFDEIYQDLNESDLLYVESFSYLDFSRFKKYMPVFLRYLKEAASCDAVGVAKSLVVQRFHAKGSESLGCEVLLDLIDVIKEVETSLGCEQQGESFCPGYERIARQIQSKQLNSDR